jgi:hypothetical protein
MKYFKILKNFYNSPKNFPDPEEFPILSDANDLAQHTRSCVVRWGVITQGFSLRR